MATAPQCRRIMPRVEMSVDARLSRGRQGADVVGRTQDLGPGGMRVATRRPLRVDEQLEFVLDLQDGTRVAGRAHVVREHACDVYGLRFDRLAAGDRDCLEALTTQTTDSGTARAGESAPGSPDPPAMQF